MKKILIAFCAVCFSLAGGQALAGGLTLHLLDVGEGQAVLLHKDQRAVLIDTGHAGRARQVLERIRELQIEALDYLFLTHLHPDHASGLFRIHDAFSPVVADNCYPVDDSMTPDMVRWTDQALRQIDTRRCLKGGDRIDWAGVEIEVLWPFERPTRQATLNQSSLVLQLRHQGKTVLIMGDAGLEAERALEDKKRLHKVDLLVVGHHGADDATSEAFLQAVRPETALISINRNNARGYPSPAVLRRLDKFGTRVHITYRDGEFSYRF